MSHQSTARPSRRRVLATVGSAGLAVVGAAGIGSVVAALAELPARHRRGAGLASVAAGTTPPAALVTALAREQQLIVRTVLARTAQPADPVLAALIADHQAHAAAIAAAIGAPSASPAPTSSATPATPSVDQLKASEQAAHDAAATESATLRGAAAVLLASIAACEAGHVELLAL